MNDNKMTWMAVLLAILLGITCGALHAYSVAENKTSIVYSEPTHYIEWSQAY